MDWTDMLIINDELVWIVKEVILLIWVYHAIIRLKGLKEITKQLIQDIQFLYKIRDITVNTMSTISVIFEVIILVVMTLLVFR
jgi:hypothetical protein